MTVNFEYMGRLKIYGLFAGLGSVWNSKIVIQLLINSIMLYGNYMSRVDYPDR